MKLLDGNFISKQIKQELAEEVKSFVAKDFRPPHLAVIIVGEKPASQIYVRNKIKSCQQVGIKSTHIELDENISQSELLLKIKSLNNDDDLDGFIVQLPLPKHISEQAIIEAISPNKDVDGFHPVNIGKLVIGLPSFVSATPKGIMELLKRYDIETQGKNVVVLGRSNIVGRPVSILLSQKADFADATVTVCHSRTKNIAEFTKNADILIAAMGKPEFVTADMVKDGVVVIDVGTTRVKSTETKSGWKLKGDVKFDEVSQKASYITPVPGGVGPMTIASLLLNTMEAYRKNIQKEK